SSPYRQRGIVKPRKLPLIDKIGALSPLPPHGMQLEALLAARRHLNRQHMLSAPLHRRQRSLCLRQPEGHPHGAVEVDSRRHFSAGLLPLAALGIQGTEAMV